MFKWHEILKDGIVSQQKKRNDPQRYKNWVYHSGETHRSCCCRCRTAGGDHDKLIHYLQYSIRSFVNFVRCLVH